ncbi:MAG: sigma-54 dependent transcriptional regulator [Syntrophorhabdales bacterium]|jgi:two-component system response regulator GlrR
MDLHRILIVDDEQPVLDVLGEVMQLAGYEATTVSEEEEALQAVQDKAYDLAIVDLQLRHLSGIDLMKKLRCFLRDMPVIILTGYGTIESAVEAMKQGAYSYLTKPIAPRDLRDHIEKALEDRRVTAEIDRLKALLEEEYGSAVIVARSDAMQRVLDVVSRVAQSDSTVYIHGESGTGKELIARTIHLASRRKERSFVALNCAALPETLLESTLFGHERGAFTGALQSKRGLFAQAHQGTMFLDEIGDMSLEIQAKVLRVLQERRFYPLGSEKLVEVDLRVIVATNKDLEEEARKGLFRSDLFYRIHVIPIHLPPLRDRKEDIPLLADYFLGRLGRQMKKEIRGLSPSAMRKLMLHDWPGNVRELENALEYAAAVTRRDVITEDLVLETRRSPTEEKLKPLKEERDAFERGYLIKLLQACQGNVSEAADLAGRGRTDFYSLLKKHDLDPADFR